MFSENIGPVELTYDGVVLGETQGGATLTYSEDEAVATADRTGNTARARVITGTVCKVVAALTEATLEQLAKVTGGTLSGTTTQQLVLSTRVGKDLVKTAKPLILKPIIEGVASTVEADWITVPKASVKPTFETPFSLENQRVWACEISGHPLTAADVGTGGGWADSGYEAGAILAFGKASGGG